VGVDQYAQQLVDAVHVVLADWLVRCVVITAQRSTVGVSPALLEAAQAMSHQATPTVMHQLTELLETDVDAQRTNPLSLLRGAVSYPTRVLQSVGVASVHRDDFAVRAFPTDIYNLSPATWIDIDESLQEPGLIWGAWKAKTVLDRRRR
jgi:hypothetical protein